MTIQRVFRARLIKLLNTAIKDYLFVKRNFSSLNPFTPGNFASFFSFAGHLVGFMSVRKVLRKLLGSYKIRCNER